MTPPENSAKSIERAWLLIKVQNIDKVKLAKDIFKQVNDKFAAKKKVFVIRADVVDGPYDLVVPIFAGTLTELNEIETFVKSLAAGMVVERARVTKHVPFPPHKAPGYVSDEEANPVNPGPTRHNPW